MSAPSVDITITIRGAELALLERLFACLGPATPSPTTVVQVEAAPAAHEPPPETRPGLDLATQIRERTAVPDVAGPPPSQRPPDEYKPPVEPPVWQRQLSQEPPRPGRATPMKPSETPAPKGAKTDRVRRQMESLAPEVGDGFQLNDSIAADDRQTVKTLCENECNFEYRTHGKRHPVRVRRCVPGRGGVVHLQAGQVA